MSTHTDFNRHFDGWQRQAYHPDRVSLSLFAAHLAVVAYVGLGWIIESRPLLFAYLLVLPLIALQWLFNGGSSVINNWESLIRSGHWHDPDNRYEGAFFQSLLQNIGLRATPAQVNLVVIAAMGLLWMTAFFRLILIPVTI